MNTLYNRRHLVVVFLTALVLCLPLTAGAKNLVANGDFARPLDQGWAVSSTAAEPSIEVATGDQNTVSVVHEAKGYTQLSQLIPVQSLDLDLSFSAMFVASVNKPNFGALAEVTVGYYGADTSLLGQTRFYRAVNHSDLKDAADQHLIAVAADSSWDDYSLNLSKEVSGHLSAVKPAQVGFVKLTLSTDNGQDEGC